MRNSPNRLQQQVWETGQALQWSMGIPLFIVLAFLILAWLHMRSILPLIHGVAIQDAPPEPALREPALVGSPIFQ